MRGSFDQQTGIQMSKIVADMTRKNAGALKIFSIGLNKAEP